ncbi:MAG: homocysteine S-methyltransferase family protein [Halofilum sp. (in: g-proteobacteria)]|nr:homocysteine S-methyltransferase family protein [Halofilum sp. (in: g-proteobacteria)]
MAQNALNERLALGPVLVAEGYLFELERRGYLQAGPFVPEVVLEHPEVVSRLHRDFVHAGSDVVEAFTYYAHREKLRVVGREGSSRSSTARRCAWPARWPIATAS